MKTFLSCFFIFIKLIIHAQDTIYYDNNWAVTTNKVDHEYYKIINRDKTDTSKATEITYYKNNQIKEEIYFENYAKKSIDGKNRSWYRSGQLRREIDYSHGKLNGKLITYWENGQLKRNDTYEMDKLIEGHIKNSEGIDIQYYDYEIMPVYPGGIDELVRFVSKQTKYPKKARKKGIKGKVIVKFTVTSNGDVINATIIQSIDKDLDAEALRVVNSMPKWKPGMSDGEKVSVYFNLPINFTLKD